MKVGQLDEFDYFIQFDGFFFVEDIFFEEFLCCIVVVVLSELVIENFQVYFIDYGV